MKNDPAPSTTVNRDTECYATENEQLEPDGVMTNPYDQAVVFITAVLLFGNVMSKLRPARILLVESMQFRNMTLGAPLLSITRNADEWLEYSNDNVTLLLSLTKNVFNGDTENYLNETVNDLAETIIKLVLPALIVMSTALFSEPFSAVTESPDTAVTVGFSSPLTSTMASVPDWPKTRYACHAAPLTRMVDNSDEI